MAIIHHNSTRCNLTKDIDKRRRRKQNERKEAISMEKSHTHSRDEEDAIVPFRICQIAFSIQINQLLKFQSYFVIRGYLRCFLCRYFSLETNLKKNFSVNCQVIYTTVVGTQKKNVSLYSKKK